ncbi:MAG: thiol:disulfide interchange protein DsbA/DsbL [Piscinibacter sp.]|nr:thiol:disulfide interchange protein DsbA/DsbL [Piscinibacter sp.]
MLGASALAVGLPAAAQGGPVEGTHYVRLGQPLAVTAPAGKVEVVEFFWYGCPHCNVFEPMLEAWAKKLPADVSFRRVPVAFRDEPFGTHQRIYYALETLNQVEAMHRKVFYAIHNDRQKLDKPADIAAFMTKNGLDGAKFVEVMNSFGVQTKARQAKQLAEAYKIDGVPALGVQGRFYTSGSLAGSPEQSLRVTDFLIERSRKA